MGKPDRGTTRGGAFRHFCGLECYEIWNWQDADQPGEEPRPDVPAVPEGGVTCPD